MPPRRVAAKRAQERRKEQEASAHAEDAKLGATEARTYSSRGVDLSSDGGEEAEGDELVSTKLKLYCTTRGAFRGAH